MECEARLKTVTGPLSNFDTIHHCVDILGFRHIPIRTHTLTNVNTWIPESYEEMPIPGSQGKFNDNFVVIPTFWKRFADIFEDWDKFLFFIIGIRTIFIEQVYSHRFISIYTKEIDRSFRICEFLIEISTVLKII